MNTSRPVLLPSPAQYLAAPPARRAEMQARLGAVGLSVEACWIHSDIEFVEGSCEQQEFWGGHPGCAQDPRQSTEGRRPVAALPAGALDVIGQLLHLVYADLPTCVVCGAGVFPFEAADRLDLHRFCSHRPDPERPPTPYWDAAEGYDAVNL